MNISVDDLKNYFAVHTTQAQFIKGLITFTVGFLFAAQPAVFNFLNAILPAGMANFAGLIFGSAILSAHDWIGNNTKWPILGASGPKVGSNICPPDIQTQPKV